MPNVAAAVVRDGGASLIGLGRGAFAYPEAPKDIIQTGKLFADKCCITCSKCSQIMRDGGRTGCVLRDSAVYGPEYRRARQLAKERSG
jgi:2,4-dienoyl-CoA reductase-like NADH-dependent reductase (Old Yellow Enzyme family)